MSTLGKRAVACSGRWVGAVLPLDDVLAAMQKAEDIWRKERGIQ